MPSAFAADFAVMTTSVTSRDTVTFQFSGEGSINVDCGTDGTLSGTGVKGTLITKKNTDSYRYSCTYQSSGQKRITFSNPEIVAYNERPDTTPVISFAGSSYVYSIKGDAASSFPDLGGNYGEYPSFVGAFQGCTNLVSIDDIRPSVM